MFRVGASADRLPRNTGCICHVVSSLYGLKKKRCNIAYICSRPAWKIHSLFLLALPQDADEFILPTGANKTRGRFELAFFTIGGCCMTGGCCCWSLFSVFASSVVLFVPFSSQKVIPGIMLTRGSVWCAERFATWLEGDAEHGVVKT